MYRDSLDKIVNCYFAAVTETPLIYKGVTIMPKTLVVSPLILRGYTCPPMCAGCCPTFSLLYLPAEIHPYELKMRIAHLNRNQYLLYEDSQEDNKNWHCRNVNKLTGRCGIHGKHPFHCDFELIKVQIHKDHYLMTQKLFSRGWAMSRKPFGKGARCEMTPVDPQTTKDVIRKLERLAMWCDHFEVSTVRIEKILDWIKHRNNHESLVLEVPNVGSEKEVRV